MRWAPRGRVLRVGLVVAACLAILGAGFLWALPEIVRRVAVARIPALTGRGVAIEDVDLNLFTGHLAISKLRLGAREGPEPFVQFDRLDLRLSLLELVRSHLHVTELVLVAPALHVVRIGPSEVNFSDLLALWPEPAAGPSRWTVTVDHLEVVRGAVLAEDRAVATPADWRIQDLAVDVAGLTTRAGAPPGRLTVGAKINDATLEVRADTLRLDPLRVGATLVLDRLALRSLNPYVFVPMGVPYMPTDGRLALTLSIQVDSDGDEVAKAVLAGTAGIEGGTMTQIGRPEPFLKVSRVGVTIKEADAISRSLTVSRVVVEGVDLEARRDPRGVIDLLAMLEPKASSAQVTPTAETGPASPAPPEESSRKLVPLTRALARGFRQIRVERITLAPSQLAFVDEAVTPTTKLALTNFSARVDDFTWPTTGPAALTLSSRMPGGGTLNVKGPVTAWPLDADLTFTLRNAPVEPYQVYIPVPARLSGRFNGDSRNRIALRDGTMVLASRGRSWAQNVEVRAPGAARPTIRVERMDLVGVDFDWPKRAVVARIRFLRPTAEIERDADGTINIRRLFSPVEAPMAARPPAPAPRRTKAAAPRRSLLETMRLEFKDVGVEEGSIRFLDRTTTPAFSQDLSRLQIGITDLSNRPDRRARLTLQTVVGGDAGLDVRGEVGPLGAAPFIDLVGELRSFKLASVDPYAASAVGWVIKQGELQYKVRFKLEDDQLSATNEVVVGRLQVAPASGADEVKRRIGLPLGLIVALVKDSKGEIRANVPITGSISDPKFDLSETIWTAVKNVLVNIVSAPFKAIGRLFSRGDKLEIPEVRPVLFEVASSVLTPEMEEHLVRVADFLRRSPFVNLAMRAVPSPADAEALKNEATVARLRDFEKERGLKDAAVAVAVYLRERLPDVALPDTLAARLELLREHEPVPEELLSALGRRRLDATRERLLAAEGIPSERLLIDGAKEGSAPPPDSTGKGRVEFSIEARGE